MKLLTIFISILFMGHGYHVSVEEVHDIHISVTEMKIENQNVEIAVKIFKDDLFVALLKHFDQKSIPEDLEQIKTLIDQYVKAKLIIKNGREEVPLSFEGIEPGFDAIWCYFKISESSVGGISLTIENRLLFEIFDDQTNILHFESDSGKKAVTFERRTPSREVKF